MPEKAVYLLVVEGFADWEPAHAVAELRRHGQYRVESVGLTSLPVRSMGGLTVLPSKTVSEVDISEARSLWAQIFRSAKLPEDAALAADSG